jgi:multiple sugar transport system permease protein
MTINQNVINRNIKKVLLHVLCIAFVLICMLPIWLLLVNATRSTGEIQTSVSFLPGNQLSENLKMLNQILSDGDISLWLAFFNSAIVSFSVVIFAVGFSALFAFVFTVYDFKLKKPIFAFVLFIIMVPSQLGIIGFYKLMVQINLIDTFVPLIMPSIVSASIVFFITQYYRIALPMEIIEAARIDGSKELGIFFRMAIPIGIPALATMGIAAFIESWNAYNLPNIILYTQEIKTLPLIIASIRTMSMGKEYMSYGSLYLSIILSILPVVVIFIMFSKKIVGGVTIGGVKE